MENWIWQKTGNSITTKLLNLLILRWPSKWRELRFSSPKAFLPQKRPSLFLCVPLVMRGAQVLDLWGRLAKQKCLVYYTQFGVTWGRGLLQMLIPSSLLHSSYCLPQQLNANMHWICMAFKVKFCSTKQLFCLVTLLEKLDFSPKIQFWQNCEFENIWILTPNWVIF